MNTSDLDLFILALVQSGLGTPYDMQVKAGLSVGSTSPVLDRLQKAGLLSATEPGSRKSRRFSITTSGEKELQAGWQSLLETPPTDIDSTLRIIFIAWLLGRRDTAVKFIGRAASSLRNLAATRTAEANQLQASLDGNARGEAFRWLRTLSSAARLEAEADVLKRVADKITSSKRNR